MRFLYDWSTSYCLQTATRQEDTVSMLHHLKLHVIKARRPLLLGDKDVFAK